MDVRYTNDDYQFLLRVSTLIFNEDESKVLLFNVTGRSFYMLPGGKNSLKTIRSTGLYTVTSEAQRPLFWRLRSAAEEKPLPIVTVSAMVLVSEQWQRGCCN